MSVLSEVAPSTLDRVDLLDLREELLARIAELERENAQYRALLLLRKDGRPEWQAHMEDAEHECDEARAVIRSVIADYEINGSLPNYALNRLRRVLDSKSAREQADEPGPQLTEGRAEEPTGRASRLSASNRADKPPKREGT